MSDESARDGHEGERDDAGIDLRDPEAFDRMLGEIGIASLIVAASSRMGTLLRRHHEPSDVVQEAILTAWRDRGVFSGRDLREVRAWFLTLVDRRIGDLARRASAAKRGGGSEPAPLDGFAGGGVGGTGPQPGGREGLPFRSTTPSQMARQLEEAALIERALDDLPEMERSLVMLTVYDVVSVAEAARRLNIGERMARDRLRQALADLRVALEETMERDERSGASTSPTSPMSPKRSES